MKEISLILMVFVCFVNMDMGDLIEKRLKMNLQEKKLFKQFKAEIQKYEIIDGFMLESILNRFISQISTRRFFNPTLKRRYYSYWVRILVQSGILEVKGMGYIVKKFNY